MRPSGLSAQRGFTLVELVVTMVIIGILAVAIVPRMSLLRGFDEIGFRDQVRGALQYARKSAVAGRRDVVVTITPTAVRLDRQRQTPEGEGTAGLIALNLPGTNSPTINAPDGMTLTAGTITFTPLGASSGGSIAIPGAGNIVVEVTGYVH